MATTPYKTQHQLVLVRNGLNLAERVRIVVSDPGIGLGQFNLIAPGRKKVQKTIQTLLMSNGSLQQVGSAVLYASQFLCCMETAKIIQSATNSPKVFDTHLLNERFYGTFDFENSAAYKTVWRRDTKNTSQHEDGVESLDQVRIRCHTFLRRLQRAYRKQRTLFIVSHDSVLCVLQSIICNTPLTACRQYTFKSAEIRIVTP